MVRVKCFGRSGLRKPWLSQPPSAYPTRKPTVKKWCCQEAQRSGMGVSHSKQRGNFVQLVDLLNGIQSPIPYKHVHLKYQWKGQEPFNKHHRRQKRATSGGLFGSHFIHTWCVLQKHGQKVSKWLGVAHVSLVTTIMTSAKVLCNCCDLLVPSEEFFGPFGPEVANAVRPWGPKS